MKTLRKLGGKKEMQNEKFVRRKDAVDLIAFNTENFLHKVQEKLDVLDIQVLSSSEQMKEIINNSVEVDLEELELGKDQTRSIYVCKDGSGKFYAIRNIRFCLLDFIEGIFTLITQKEYRVMAGVFFLCKMMKQIEVDLEDSQAAICIALYIETKQCVVTDENLIKAITDGLSRSSYYELSENDIYKDLKELMRLGIIKIEEGKYTLTQKVYFM